MHYRTDRIAYSLRTRSAAQAKVRALSAAAKLEQHWHFLRMSAEDLPGKHLMVAEAEQRRPKQSRRASKSEAGPTLGEAVELYLRLKGAGRPKTFEAGIRRSCGYLIDATGSKRLTQYSRRDATKFRDFLIERGLNGASVTRVVGTVRAVFNMAISETGLVMPNPFRELYLDGKAGVGKRQPFPLDTIRQVQSQCYIADDDRRWLVAIIADTGMRLAEVAGLTLDDFKLDEDHPHVLVRPHPWRRLKTDSSQRVVPLVGSALWAAGRIKETSATSFAFPRYNKTAETNANSASAALNKWLKQTAGRTYSVHSFRHALRDRLRAVECPADIVDQIGGWHTEGVGQSYGNGYPLDVLHKWMNKMAS